MGTTAKFSELSLVMPRDTVVETPMQRGYQAASALYEATFDAAAPGSSARRPRGASAAARATMTVKTAPPVKRVVFMLFSPAGPARLSSRPIAQYVCWPCSRPRGHPVCLLELQRP